ncbi:hypothetical protein ElyMa_002448900 [Elysia marginata]|uniref:Uncharacterized protein n=1 Tax=Elysia marginata TaxID=1093978 RepID=A0AAV4GJ64_9GAST|nr:hypothetical protein ElyMa_002448900 [Elysia marginata]
MLLNSVCLNAVLFRRGLAGEKGVARRDCVMKLNVDSIGETMSTAEIQALPHSEQRPLWSSWEVSDATQNPQCFDRQSQIGYECIIKQANKYFPNWTLLCEITTTCVLSRPFFRATLSSEIKLYSHAVIKAPKLGPISLRRDLFLRSSGKNVSTYAPSSKAVPLPHTARRARVTTSGMLLSLSDCRQLLVCVVQGFSHGQGRRSDLLESRCYRNLDGHLVTSGQVETGSRCVTYLIVHCDIILEVMQVVAPWSTVCSRNIKSHKSFTFHAEFRTAPILCPIQKICTSVCPVKIYTKLSNPDDGLL